MKNKVRFKFLPNKQPLGAYYRRFKKLPKDFPGTPLETLDEVPIGATREGSYLVRYGKGDHIEYEYLPGLKVWIEKGRVQKYDRARADYIDLPNLSDKELEAMRLVSDKLTMDWQELFLLISSEREGRAIRRQNRAMIQKWKK